MISSFQLFKLVKSLSKEEKRFFSINNSYTTAKDKTAHYLQLFDSLDAITVWDERQFKQLRLKSAWAKNYPNLKTYLYEALLKSLTLQHRQADAYMQLFTLLQQWQILLQRNMHDLAFDILQQAEQLVQDVDLAFMAATIAYLKVLSHTLFFSSTENFEANKAKFYELQQNIEQATIHQNQYFQQYLLHHQIHVYYQSLAYMPKEELIETFLPQARITKNLQNLGPKTQALAWYNLEHIEELLQQTPDPTYAYKMVELYQNNPKFCQNNVANYSTVLFNAISKAIYVHDFSQAQKYLTAYQDPIFNQLSNIYHIIHQNQYIILSLYFYTHQWDFLAAQHIITERQADLADFQKKIPPQHFSLVYFYTGLTAFGLKKIDLALSAWASFYDDKLAHARPYQIHTYFLRLLLLWENQQWPVLLYRLEQTKRFLKKHSPNTLFIQLIYRFIRRSALQPQQAQQALAQFHNALSHYVCDEHTNPFTIFDYSRWAAQHLNLQP